MATNGLGRGLSSLIPQKTNINPAKQSQNNIVVNGKTAADSKDKILQVDIKQIDINPMQPRKEFADVEMDELAASIKEYGIIQPLIATRQNGRFELIAGERRWRAAKEAGLDKVPVIIRDASQQEKLELALVENIQRENLNPIDLAHAYKKLVDEFNLTQEEVAIKVGKARPSVTNTLRILNLPEEIQLALIEGKITEGHAKYLIGLDNEAKQINLFRKILHSNLTVKDTSQEARRMGGTKAARIKINYTDMDKEFALREFFGTKVEIRRKGKGGQIILEFYSEEELDNIISKVKK